VPPLSAKQWQADLLMGDHAFEVVIREVAESRVLRWFNVAAQTTGSHRPGQVSCWWHAQHDMKQGPVESARKTEFSEVKWVAIAKLAIAEFSEKGACSIIDPLHRLIVEISEGRKSLSIILK
jgi:hypothetical protein